ncbi:DotA/TraY family protein [Acetobacter malorum]|nr:DotA/TraY family protein [Acetobacter malorum]KXV06505.1 hypothetical protein AD930_07860 [Acetobacter malorum]
MSAKKQSDFAARGKKELRGMIVDDLIKNKGVGFGIGVTRDFQSAVETTQPAYSWIKRALFSKSILGAQLEDLPTTSSDPKVRFDTAREVYGITQDEESRVQDAKYKQFWTYVAVSIVVASLILNEYLHGYFSIHMAFLSLAVMCSLFVGMFISAFYNWQIRTERLGLMSHFLARPKEWFPVPVPRGAAKSQIEGRTGACLRWLGRKALAMVRVLKRFLALAVIGGVCLRPEWAHAAVGVSATSMLQPPPSSDLWGRVLGMVFPDIPPLSESSGAIHTAISNGIQGGMGAFITDLTAVSLFMFMYQTIVGTAETAHQGELLGRKWHTMWSLPRVCYGYAALAPVVQGFCLLQVLIVYVAIVSGNMGNTILSSFVDDLIKPQAISPPPSDTDQMALNTFKMEACYATYRAIQQNNGAGSPPYPTKSQVETSFLFHPITFIVHGFNKTISGDDLNTAGSGTDNQTRTTWDFGPCGSVSILSPVTAADAAGTLAKSQISAFDQFLVSLRSPAENVYKATISGSDGIGLDGMKDEISSVFEAKKTYDLALGQATASFVENVRQTDLSDFKSAVEQAGWASIGAYYMTIARINTAIMAVAKNTPQVSAVSADSNESDGLNARLNAKPNGIYTIADDAWNQMMIPSQKNLDKAATAMNAMHGGAEYYLKQMFSSDSKVQGAALSLALDGFGGDANTYDAMQETTIMGNYIVDAGETALGLSGVGASVLMAAESTPEGKMASLVGRVNNFAGKGGSVMSSLAEKAGWALFFMFLALMTAGIYDAFILPLLPYLHFFFATMGILILTVEGVIAGPIWAFMHIRMDGDELFTGAQSPGYKILFNLFFRIPLTLFGFFFSMLIFDATIWLQHITIWPAMESATADATFGLVGTIVYMLVITGMTYAIANRSFTMITGVPDRVTRWFAGESAANGDETNVAVGNISSIRGRVQGGVTKASQLSGSGGGGGKDGGGGNAVAGNRAAEAARDATTEAGGDASMREGSVQESQTSESGREAGAVAREAGSAANAPSPAQEEAPGLR